MEVKKRMRPTEHGRYADKQSLVGDSEDLLPFAWRTPPEVVGRHKSKVLRTLEQEEEIRMAPPVPNKRK